MKKLVFVSLLLICSCVSHEKKERERIQHMISLEAKYALKYPETYQAREFTELIQVPADYYFSQFGKALRDSIFYCESRIEQIRHDLEFDSTMLADGPKRYYGFESGSYKNKIKASKSKLDSLNNQYLILKEKIKEDSTLFVKQKWFKITHFFVGKNAYGVPDQSSGTFYLNERKDSVVGKIIM